MSGGGTCSAGSSTSIPESLRDRIRVSDPHGAQPDRCLGSRRPWWSPSEALASPPAANALATAGTVPLTVRGPRDRAAGTGGNGPPGGTRPTLGAPDAVPDRAGRMGAGREERGRPLERTANRRARDAARTIAFSICCPHGARSGAPSKVLVGAVGTVPLGRLGNLRVRQGLPTQQSANRVNDRVRVDAVLRE